MEINGWNGRFRQNFREKLSSNLTRLMTNPKFIEYYDKFCSTPITITKLVSKEEDIKEQVGDLDLLTDQ